MESCKIKAEPSGFESLGNVDFGIILGLKTNKGNSIEFTSESHIIKLKILFNSIDKFVQKQLTSKNSQLEKISTLGLFNQLAQQVPLKNKQ